MNIDNVIIEPVDVAWGKYQRDKITCVADVASSLNNKYLKVYSAKDAVKYALWFNVGGAGAAPVVAGHTLVAVAIAVGASKETVAAALATALDLIAAFRS